uniref:Histone-lysine N-methyltransferase, H3 lysine-36 specific n=1 Tax=Blastobotrys adeninivorans TaxID=409370 RepID=A0A060T9H8_BLAAD
MTMKLVEKMEKDSSPEASSPRKKSTSRSTSIDSRPQLFNDRESKTEEAQKTYVTLLECTFTPKSLGGSRQDEIYSCDCREQWDGTVNLACGEDSDCINRLTSVECPGDEKTNCGEACRNQRFQRREYAPVDVIQTDKKGYGMRALEDIPAGTFVYEYIGEVIDEARFQKRMKQYEEQKRPHFYFMMLQKGEFIDATVKGSLARFCNHSCNPNSYVDKWVVRGKLRMGIFTKRHVLKGEEITFDYNVDRYGTQAQKCYCGEPNCIGYLGGKTQTEAASKLPRLLVDGLGLDDSDQRSWITTTAKLRKSKKLKDGEVVDEESVALLPTKPVAEDAVSKVMASLLQCREEWLVNKLIERIYITNDSAVNFRVMRMHGYQIFSLLLRDWKEYDEVTTKILEILGRWPKLTKNKISSSKIEDTVIELSKKSTSPDVRQLASQLLQDWGNLKMAYRIPRRERPSDAQSQSPSQTNANSETNSPNGINGSSNHAVKREEESTPNPPSSKSPPRDLPTGPRSQRSQDNNDKPLPAGWESATSESGRLYYFNRSLNVTSWTRPEDPQKLSKKEKEKAKKKEKKKKKKLQDDEQESGKERTTPGPELLRSQQLQKIIEQANSIRAQMHSSSPPASDSPEQDDVKRTLTKTFARYVPNLVARHEKEIGHEKVKKHSREIVAILVEKETRPGREVVNPRELSDDKKAKIKLFVKSYMDKVLSKHREKHGGVKPRPHDSNGHGRPNTAPVAESPDQGPNDNTSEADTKKRRIPQPDHDNSKRQAIEEKVLPGSANGTGHRADMKTSKLEIDFDDDDGF